MKTFLAIVDQFSILPLFIVVTRAMAYFLILDSSLQETDLLEIVLLRDVRTGKSAKVPKVCVL